MTKLRDYGYIALFLALVLALWTTLSFLPGPDFIVPPKGEQGGHDLTGLDFTDTVYRLPQAWDTWLEQLLTPGEIDSAPAPVPYSTINPDETPFATYRQYLTLIPGVTYGISCRSSDYAMRLFLDGEEIVTAGNPGATEEENIPRLRDVVHYFTPQRETVELVVQSSNYVHFRDGSKAPAFVVGTAENVARYVRNLNLKNDVVFGCLLVAFLYHFAIFLLNRRQRASLLFAILCLAMCFSSGHSFVLLFPEYDWLFFFRVEYTCTITAAVGLVLLIHTLFPGLVHRWVRWGFLAVSGVYFAIVMLSPPIFFTRVLAVFQAAIVAVVGYLVVRLAMNLREKKRKNTLAFLGFGLYGLFSIYDILHRNTSITLLDIGETQIADATSGMVLLVCCYALVVAIDQAVVNRRLEETRAALAAAESRCRELLAQGQQNGLTPTSRLLEFGLTKRETEVALLLLDGKSRQEVAGLLCISAGTVNTHCSNLYRKAGCGNVADLTRLMLPNAPGREIS